MPCFQSKQPTGSGFLFGEPKSQRQRRRDRNKRAHEHTDTRTRKRTQTNFSQPEVKSPGESPEALDLDGAGARCGYETGHLGRASLVTQRCLGAKLGFLSCFFFFFFSENLPGLAFVLSEHHPGLFFFCFFFCLIENLPGGLKVRIRCL